MLRKLGLVVLVITFVIAILYVAYPLFLPTLSDTQKMFRSDTGRYDGLTIYSSISLSLNPPLYKISYVFFNKADYDYIIRWPILEKLSSIECFKIVPGETKVFAVYSVLPPKQRKVYLFQHDSGNDPKTYKNGKWIISNERTCSTTHNLKERFTVENKGMGWSSAVPIWTYIPANLEYNFDKEAELLLKR